LERVIEKLPYFGKQYKLDKEKERQRAENGDEEPGNSLLILPFLKKFIKNKNKLMKTKLNKSKRMCFLLILKVMLLK